jgi:AcrR family transcriptional regulator
MTRKYVLARRAASQEETRLRIVQAAVRLHEERGPARTTISDIAERSGVERATVYRHFPDERSLFTACTSHYYAQHPPPDPAAWAGIIDREDRLLVALTEIYAYHRQTEPMIDRAQRDLPDVPVMWEVLAPRAAHWARVHETLAGDWQSETAQEPLILAALGHALSFSTWHSLVRDQGLDDAQAVEAMIAMVRALAARQFSPVGTGDD